MAILVKNIRKSASRKKKAKLDTAEKSIDTQTVSEPAAELSRAVAAANDSDLSKPTTYAALPRINRAAIIETIVFLVAAVLLDFMFGESNRFLDKSLHPFWIIVLLVTVQYGPIEALIAALLSTAFLLVGNLPEQSLSETMYEYIMRITMNPFLWVVAALILGSIRARQRNERKNLLNQLWNSEQAAAAIAENYKAAKQSKERLELRLAEERCSVLTVFEVAKVLETLDPIEAMDGIEKLVRTAMNPKKFSFFRWKNNALALDASFGWDKDDTYEARFHANTPLAMQIAKDMRVLSIIRGEDEAILDGQGMMAGPIIDEKSGKIYGMLKIEETGFADLGIRAHETFRIICSWIARVCANVDLYQEARGKVPGSKTRSPRKRRAAAPQEPKSAAEATDNAA